MNLMRKLGWTFLLLSSGVAGGCAPPASAPLPPAGTPAPRPPAQPGQPPEADAAAPAWPWFLEEEDEFEGDGWTFWGR